MLQPFRVWVAVVFMLGLCHTARAVDPLSLLAEERSKKVQPVYNEHNEAAIEARAERTAATEAFRPMDAMAILTSLPEPAPIKNLLPEAK